MNIQTNLAKTADLSRTYQTQHTVPAQRVERTERTERTERAEAVRRFDSVTISGEKNRRSSFEMDLRKKLTQEVRTATSSGQVAALRDEIQAGAYRIDAGAIAGKMLLLGEAG